MPCTVKCLCGKAEMKFKKLKPDQIKAFECPSCTKEAKPEPRAPKDASKIHSNPYSRPRKPAKRGEDKAPDAEQIAEIEAEKESE